MNNNIILSTITYILMVFLLSSCASSKRMDSWKQLTLVDDPFEFQNPYFPIKVGNQWNYEIRTQNVGGNLTRSGTLKFWVANYKFVEFYLGDSLVYAPLFKLNGTKKDLSSKIDSLESYALKTNQGIVLIDSLPEDSTLSIFRFVPISSKYFDFFPDLHSFSFTKDDPNDSTQILILKKAYSVNNKIYYKKNVGLIKMNVLTFIQTKFNTTTEKDYTLTDYVLK